MLRNGYAAGVRAEHEYQQQRERRVSDSYVPSASDLKELRRELFDMMIPSGDFSEESYVKIEKVLKKKPNLDITGDSHDDYTLLGWAIHKNDPRLVKLLLSYGANVNQKDRAGYTPLHRAVQSGSLYTENLQHEIIKILIDHGADLNATDNFGHKPVDNAEKEVRESFGNGINGFTRTYKSGTPGLLKRQKWYKRFGLK